VTRLETSLFKANIGTSHLKFKVLLAGRHCSRPISVSAIGFKALLLAASDVRLAVTIQTEKREERERERERERQRDRETERERRTKRDACN